MYKAFKMNLFEQEYEYLEQIEDANKLMALDSHYHSVDNAKILTIHALYQDVYKKEVPKEIIDDVYKYVLDNPESETLIEAFINLLKISKEAGNMRPYLTKELASNAFHTALYNPINGSGIDEIDEFAEMMMHACSPEYSQPYVRQYKKVGNNDLCPCGSGKKFKKCCKGKGNMIKHEV